MFKKLMKDERGFTLVELIVVIAIMAVLATLLIPRIMGNVEDAAKQSSIGTARTLASEITVYNAKKIIDKANGVTGATTCPTSLPATGVTYTLKDTDVSSNTDLKLPTGTKFPNKDYVEIIIDSSGNASLNIKGTPTTTP